MTRLTAMIIVTNDVIVGSSYSDNCKWRGVIFMPNGRLLISTPDCFNDEEEAITLMENLVKSCKKLV